MNIELTTPGFLLHVLGLNILSVHDSGYGHVRYWNNEWHVLRDVMKLLWSWNNFFLFKFLHSALVSTAVIFLLMQWPATPKCDTRSSGTATISCWPKLSFYNRSDMLSYAWDDWHGSFCCLDREDKFRMSWEMSRWYHYTIYLKMVETYGQQFGAKLLLDPACCSEVGCTMVDFSRK